MSQIKPTYSLKWLLSEDFQGEWLFLLVDPQSALAEEGTGGARKEAGCHRYSLSTILHRISPNVSAENWYGTW
jgi:hypothetical protein